MSNLDKVMNKLRSQKSKSEVPKIEDTPMKKKIKKVPEIEEEEEQEEEDEKEEEDEQEGEEDEEDEDEEEEKPSEKVKKEVKVEETPEKLSEQRAEEIQILQNDGVFRVELLYRLGQINASLVELTSLINKAIK